MRPPRERRPAHAGRLGYRLASGTTDLALQEAFYDKATEAAKRMLALDTSAIGFDIVQRGQFGELTQLILAFLSAQTYKLGIDIPDDDDPDGNFTPFRVVIEVQPLSDDDA